MKECVGDFNKSFLMLRRDVGKAVWVYTCKLHYAQLMNYCAILLHVLALKQWVEEDSELLPHHSYLNIYKN